MLGQALNNGKITNLFCEFTYLFTKYWLKTDLLLLFYFRQVIEKMRSFSECPKLSQIITVLKGMKNPSNQYLNKCEICYISSGTVSNREKRIPFSSNNFCSLLFLWHWKCVVLFDTTNSHIAVVHWLIFLALYFPDGWKWIWAFWEA